MLIDFEPARTTAMDMWSIWVEGYNVGTMFYFPESKSEQYVAALPFLAWKNESIIVGQAYAVSKDHMREQIQQIIEERASW